MENKDRPFIILSQDKHIGENVKSYGPLPDLTKNTNTFAALCKSIVSQQLSVKAAETIYDRYVELVKEKENPKEILKIAPDEFRSVGLSNQKATYIMEVANFWNMHSNLESDLLAMEDTEVIKLLTQIKGVGEWTVHMLLIFHFHRENVLPLGDLIVRKGIIHFYQLNPESKFIYDECKEATQDWLPYASYGSRYMWAFKDKIILQ
jgi:DNA-3-methyladenine glycosylase II